MSRITRRHFVICAGSVAAGSRLCPSFAGNSFETPLEQATAVWNMTTLNAIGRHPLTLSANGKKEIQLGVKLDAHEYAESLRRGGDGHIAIFNNPTAAMLETVPEVFANAGWLSVDAKETTVLRPKNSTISIYARAFFEKIKGSGTLLFSDSIGLAVDECGLAIAFLGQGTSQGTLLREIPLGVVEQGIWLDLIARIGDGRLDFYCNGTLKNSIAIRGQLRSPVENPFIIGGFGKAWHHPRFGDVLPFHCLTDTKVDTIALWDCALTDSQLAFLSGVNDIHAKRENGAAGKAIAAYNQFYDASQNKDLEGCHASERTIREFMRQDPCRPTYHLTASLGWLYDPSAAFYYQGKYHVFSYQNIYSLLWYNGKDHYVSEDLVHWRMWPTAPFADSELDVYGIWLANHAIDDEGLPNIIYAGFGERGEEHGIRARSHDGMISYTEKKLVIPEYHDGHTWKEGNTWYAITMRDKDADDPKIVIYSSMNLNDWTERGVLFRPRDYFERNVSGMEFPYLISMGDKDVLMAGCMPAGVFYWVGRFDRKDFKFYPDHIEGLRIDYANPFHCFNPSAVDAKGPDGSPRRIIMAMEARPKGRVEKLPWNGVHAMPRLLSLDGDHLRQDPLPEFESLRGKHQSIRNIVVKPNASGQGSARGDALEILAEFKNNDAKIFGLKVRLSRDRKTFLRVFYDAKTNEYGVDGNIASGSGDQGRGPSYISSGKPVQMRIFLDKALVETFVNGQTCTTSLGDTNPLHDGLELFSEGGSATCSRLDIWQMKGSF